MGLRGNGGCACTAVLEEEILTKAAYQESWEGPISTRSCRLASLLLVARRPPGRCLRPVRLPNGQSACCMLVAGRAAARSELTEPEVAAHHRVASSLLQFSLQPRRQVGGRHRCVDSVGSQRAERWPKVEIAGAGCTDFVQLLLTTSWEIRNIFWAGGAAAPPDLNIAPPLLKHLILWNGAST